MEPDNLKKSNDLTSFLLFNLLGLFCFTMEKVFHFRFGGDFPG
jgi:hypothetical protein